MSTGSPPAPLVPGPPVDPSVGRARWSLMTMFVALGVLGTSWMSRMPSVRAALDVSSGQLGLLLTAGACGALVAVLFSGALVTRIGSRATLGWATAFTLVGFLLLAGGVGTANTTVFGAGAFLGGVCGALMNIAINLNAARVEQRVGRAILPHFHAAFSIGAGIGSLIGAACSRAHLPIQWQLVVVPVLVTMLRVALIRPATALDPAVGRTRVVDAPADRAGGADPDASSDRRRGPRGGALSAWLEPRTLLIGVVLLASSLSEGAAGTWLSTAVHGGFPVSEATGALAYASFVVAQTAVRFAGTGLIDRFGRVAVLRASNVSAFVGVALFGLTPSIALAWAGVVLWGFGAALGNPLCIAAASDDPERAPARVSVVASFSSVAMLSGPPVLGLLAESLGGERRALLTICAVALLSLAVSGSVRPLGRPGEPRRDAATA